MLRNSRKERMIKILFIIAFITSLLLITSSIIIAEYNFNYGDTVFYISFTIFLITLYSFIVYESLK